MRRRMPIRIKVKSWIRIHVQVKIWTRIHITVKRIRKSALNVHELYAVVQKTKLPQRPEREFKGGRPCLAADPWSSQTPPPEESWTSAGSQWCPLTIVNFFSLHNNRVYHLPTWVPYSLDSYLRLLRVH
jgi:hypothetical protein